MSLIASSSRAAAVSRAEADQVLQSASPVTTSTTMLVSTRIKLVVAADQRHELVCRHAECQCAAHALNAFAVFALPCLAYRLDRREPRRLHFDLNLGTGLQSQSSAHACWDRNWS